MNTLSIEARLDRLETLLDAVSQMMAIDFQSAAPIARIDRIKAIVCREFRVTAQMLHSPSRVQHIVLPRMVAMTLARQHVCLSYQAIAQQFGKLNHGAVMNAVKAIADRCEVDAPFRATFDRCAQSVRAMTDEPIREHPAERPSPSRASLKAP